ncbi:MAG: DEAD/DEAH box helicase [Chloroflexota bacterium]
MSTTFYFKDPLLRSSFDEALRSGHLSKGPFLEATPVFKRGLQTGELFQDLLGVKPDLGFLEAVHHNRALYQHQEEAIRRASNGRNVIVATGTGSGKTEAFLYPILCHLYQEFRRGGLSEGVRALILYPMNALANDQRERLGEICKQLEEGKSPFRLTFGQYIGETPEDENDTRRHARDHLAGRLPGELVLRREVRQTPPHILLTNYSMLEYLLLRPEDSPLFDGGRAQCWTFLVLDEAHQYRGSRGIEMAMLVRRLKQRLKEGGRSEPFRCIATSATLAGGEGDKAAVAQFASHLFGEAFHEQDVILGESEPIPELSDLALTPRDYRRLADVLCEASPLPQGRVLDVSAKLGVSFNGDARRQIGAILQRDRRAARLRRLISGTPSRVEEIAAQVFDDLPPEERVSAIAEFVALLLQARVPDSGAPLLSARYHLFIRSLEGAFVSYWPCKNVFLERKTEDEKTAAFEVALCRECGQHYFVGQMRDGKLVEAIRDPSHPGFGADFFRPIENDTFDGDEEGDSSNIRHRRLFRLCARCGQIDRAELRCGHSDVIPVEREDPPTDEDRADQMARCSACGYNAAGRDPVREVVHGADGPNAVIATTLYRSLPEKRKKVLAFADGRQEAAFFAWYLEDTYKHILTRNLLLKAAEHLSPHAQEGLTLRELAVGLRDLFRKRNVFPPATGDLELRREGWLRLYREFFTDEPRIALEGVGLARWSLKWPDWLDPSQIFMIPPWSLTEPEARDLAFILLDTMRADRAVELRTEKGVSLQWSDLGLQAAQIRFRIGPPKGKRGVRSWDGGMGKRARFLAKLLVRRNTGMSVEVALEEATNSLRGLWDLVRQSDEHAPSAADRLLIPVDDARRLNPDWWRLRLITPNDTLFECDACGRIQAVSVGDVCLRHGCPGTLRQALSEKVASNHYRLLYQEDLPGILRVEEHTAQLDQEKAREFQRDFRADRIHVLSCSTTFELGVDLGNLDTIFLRNVPPEAFNYAQRVGRAGRRGEHPGIAITYCRRGPHDLYHFAEPERMLSGKVRPPVLSVRNEKIITRHITATALSRFFRTFPERFKRRGDSVSRVEALLMDMANPIGVSDFKAFISSHRLELEETLRAIVPRDTHYDVGLSDGTWTEAIAGSESRFSLAEAEVSSDFRTVNSLEEAAAAEGDYDTAKWARARARTIAQEDVLSFLSRKAVIPKYGFPVDVVELDTQRTQQTHEAFEVLLQRDLSIAISEFAPTSKLVANKKLWTSHGLKRVAEKEWPRKFYKRCARHNIFLQWREGEPEPLTPCSDILVPRKYVEPRFGFITDRERPVDPKSRPIRVFTTRPYFGHALGHDPGTVSMPGKSPLLTMRKASPGLMVVLCEGRRGEGFYICGSCGAGLRKPKSPHKTPQNSDCYGTLDQVSLGHEFVTDVLQLQFHRGQEEVLEPVWFAFSLAYALVEGAAEVLEVPSTDLSATVAHATQHPMPPIVLYDNVPGGAGLVARLEGEDIFRECLEAARKRVGGNCGCNDDTSCYGCLRSYKNQFAHLHLQRGAAMRYLDMLLSQWR